MEEDLLRSEEETNQTQLRGHESNRSRANAAGEGCKALTEPNLTVHEFQVLSQRVNDALESAKSKSRA